MPNFAVLLVFFSAYVSAFVTPTVQQIAMRAGLDSYVPREELPLVRTDNLPKKIAIIGSGITGASAASRLYEGFRFSTPADRQPSITVFERNPIIGGRITQAYAYDNMQFPVDTCAATFDNVDMCIAQSAMIVGLTLEQRAVSKPRAGNGIWDGDKLVAVEEQFRNALLWSEYRRDHWSERYGDSPASFASVVSQLRLSLSLALSAAQPLLNYSPTRGIANLSADVEGAGLTEFVQSFECARLEPDPSLDGSPQAKRFAREIVNAGARERYFANGDELNVLEYQLGFQDQFESFIREGNIRLIERLLKLSTTDVRLGAEVQKIETGGKKGVKLTVVPTGGGMPTTESFDMVVLATPYSLANITFEPQISNATHLEQQYLDSFVTHFTSSSRLNRTFFNHTGTMPQNILTTTEAYSNGTSTFLSLQLLRRLPRPGNTTPGKMDNLYKLVSREEIPFAEIEKYLEEPANITWIDVQPLPRSVPVRSGQGKQGCIPVIENLQIAPGVYYAGAGEQVVASADFGCRLGINVADLVLMRQ